MSLDALLAELEARTVTPVTVATNKDATEKPLEALGCTVITPVTADNISTLTPPLDTSLWKRRYHALVAHYARSGYSQNEAQWQAMNETFSQCCESYGVLFDSDDGYSIMRALTTATHFNPVLVA